MKDQLKNIFNNSQKLNGIPNHKHFNQAINWLTAAFKCFTHTHHTACCIHTQYSLTHIKTTPITHTHTTHIHTHFNSNYCYIILDGQDYIFYEILDSINFVSGLMKIKKCIQPQNITDQLTRCITNHLPTQISVNIMS